MIVPQNRLMLWVAVVFLPFSLLGAVDPSLALVSAAAVGVLLVLAGIDAVRSRKAFPGLSVHLAPVVRLSKDRQAKLEVRIRNQPQTARALRLALDLPREIGSQQEAPVLLPAAAEWSRLDWPCFPRQRGRFQINRAYLEAPSPWGLWLARGSVPAAAEIRVYPNLAADRKTLAPMFLNRGSFGVHAQRQVGKGRDFEKLREYLPGDSYDEIHWKATARRGHPITKVFQIERTQEVYIVLDSSRLSARPISRRSASGPGEPGSPEDATDTSDQPLTPLERFITAALVLGLAAEHQGDLFGLVTFADKVEKFLPARNGKAHYSTCRDTLYLLQPKTVSPDFDELFTFLRLRLRRRALLVFLTSLDDPALAESFVRNVELLRRQHLVLVNMIQPPGIEPLFSDPEVDSVDDLYRTLGGHLLWQKLRQLQKVLQRRGVRFSLLRNEQLAAQLVSQYVSVKQRQSL